MKRITVFKPDRGGGEFKSYNGRAAIEAMYKSKDWENYSKKYLETNPKCYACGSRSQAVDHLKAHKGDKLLFWKADNLLPLCHKCHNRATALFDRFHIQKFQEKLNWLARCRSVNQLTFKVMVLPTPTISQRGSDPD